MPIRFAWTLKPGAWSLLLLALACGGEQGVRPQADGGVAPELDPCSADDGLVMRSIDDFELGRAIGWWADNDGTAGSTMDPPAGASSPPATEIPGGRCGVSRYALHVTAEGLETWGGALGTYFFPGPVDASAWEGIAMWVRLGSTSAERTMFFTVDDRYTDEVHGRELFAEGQPYCLEESVELTRKCDRFSVGLGLEGEWRFVAIPFEKLQQRGFGRIAPVLDLRNLLGLGFSFSTGERDIWIDDLSFYRAPRP